MLSLLAGSFSYAMAPHAVTASDYMNLDMVNNNKDATITVTNMCASDATLLHGEKCMLKVDTIDCPSDEPQPLNFKFSGEAEALEAIDKADLHVVAKFGGVKMLDKTMSACGEQTIDLPLGAGTITLDMLSCPVADGAKQSITGTVAAKQALPFGKLDIDISAADSSGNKLLDLDVVVKA